MKTRHTIAFGLIAFGVIAACGLLLNARNEKTLSSSDDSWFDDGDSDDPFADMIEEGAGLIAQLKAEAADLARRIQRA